MFARFQKVCTVLLGVFVLLIGASSAEAQTSSGSSSDEHGGIGFAIKAGPLFSKLNSDIITDPIDTFDTKIGWIGGVQFGGNRPGIVGAQLDVLYARKKVGTPTGDADLDYIEIPVLLRLNAGAASAAGARVFAVVGPAFDIRLKGRLDLGSSFNDQTQGFDIGIAAGGGVEFARIILEGRYTRGLRDLGKDLTSSQKITTQTVALMVGIRFN